MLIKILANIFILLEKCKWYYIYNTYRKKYDIASSFKFNGYGIQLYGEGKIILGSNSYIGEGSTIQSFNNAIVKIGNNCSISHYVRIYTYNNNPRDIISNKEVITKSFGNVIIGDNCWIGVGVFIKEGITIGNNCVIGANSVVTKDIPSNSIVGGIPAKTLMNIDKSKN